MISDNNNNFDKDEVDLSDPQLKKEQERIIKNQQLFEIELTTNTTEKERIKEISLTPEEEEDISIKPLSKTNA